jgi:hypothetical protein
MHKKEKSKDKKHRIKRQITSKDLSKWIDKQAGA